MRSLTLLIPLLFLSSCTIDWNDEKDKKIAGLEKQVTEVTEKNNDHIFSRKQKCTSSLWELTSYFKKIDQEDTLNTYEFVEVFYSEVKNDCLWIFSTGDFTSGRTFFLISTWSPKIENSIDRCSESAINNFNDNPVDTSDCDTFNKKIKQLKSE